MKTFNVARLAVLSALFLAPFGCSAPTSQADGALGSAAIVSAPPVSANSAREIDASVKVEQGLLGAVWEVRRIDNGDGLDLHLFELGGGDPALNGDLIWLAIGGPNGDREVFDLGINIRSLTKAESTATGSIHLVGMQDTLDAQGEILSGQPFDATLTFATSGEAPKTVVVRTTSGAVDVQRETDAPSAFLGTVYKVTRAESEASLARVFTTSGGDSVMNGAHVFLNLMSLPEDRSFDLGLDVAEVTKLSFTSVSELRIEGSEDTMGADGHIRTKRFACSVTFAVDGSGMPPKSVTLTRL